MPGWKPLPEDPGPRPVGQSLDRVASSLGVPKASSIAGVFARWSELVGESVAAHTTPRRLRDGVLSITVDEPIWATQLRFLEADLLTRLEEHLGPGSVTKIDVRVARD